MQAGLQKPRHGCLRLRHTCSSTGRSSGGGGRRAITVRAYRIRRATVEDAEAVADIYAQTFGTGNFPGQEGSPLVQQVEARYAAAVGRESGSKLVDALQNKAQAATAARTYRLQRQAAMFKGQLAMARGLPATFPTEGPTELRQLAKWRRARRFVCLVAEEVEERPTPAAEPAAAEPAAANSSSGSSNGSSGSGSSGNGSSSSSSSSPRRWLVGTATISMMQAEAALPPPFPSGAPLRPYVSNMAVLPAARRRGLATALAGACGRIAVAWGEPAVLLHVAADNASAQQLYSGCGFTPVANSSGLGGLIRGPWTQQRMAAAAAELASHYPRRGGQRTAAAAAAAADSGSSGGSQQQEVLAS